MRGCQRGVLEGVEQSQLVLEPEGAIEALVALIDLAQGAQLIETLAVGALS